MTCICTNPSSVYHILLECPTTTALFQNLERYDFTSCNSVINIVSNTDVIIPVAKFIVRSAVGKSSYYNFSNVGAKKMNG